ncbi:MAG: hypothetical protein Q8J68_03930 [Methanolobus sp.]|nr:hypothetical protein [Methanolobus sp.]MDP2216421.1 hypothetical protein [Methanolobus sp.]
MIIFPAVSANPHPERINYMKHHILIASMFLATFIAIECKFFTTTVSA